MTEVSGTGVGLETIWQVSRGGKGPYRLAEAARARVRKSRDYIEKRLADGEVIYGVNTGFGAFSSVRISDTQIEELQRNLIRSHCAGVGTPFSKEETRAIMFLRANALATGLSGIREVVIDKLLEFLSHDILPVIPQQGSVGASGDLAPLSHLALALIGEGEVWDGEKQVSVDAVLRQRGISPLVLKAKEGLSLINGCQVMTAVGMLNAYEARRLNLHLDLAGALTLEALRGSRKAFDPLIAASRPHPGEAKTARNLLKFLEATSPIADSHINCTKVQDAYSLRCMPAVHGATKDSLRYVIQVLETEANSSTDNPLVFADDNKILSCGNFHGEPVAFALDFLAISVAANANISECRIEKLINPAMSELPAFLAPDGGLNSGMMIVQVAAASLVSENKIHTHPASVDSIPTSADKEDHVSMGTIAARKLGQIVRNAESVAAMEILCATQALDFLKPLKASRPLQAVYDVVRQQVPFAEKDRVFAKDVEVIRNLIRNDSLMKAAQSFTGELEW